MSDEALPARDWLARRGAWARSGLAALAGASMTLAQPPVSLPWVLFLAVPALVALLARARSHSEAAAIGWAAGYGYLVTGLHWIGHAFLVDPEKFAWLMPFAVGLLPAWLAVYWAAAGVLVRRLAPEGGARGALALAACLTLAELARGHLTTGFPWGLAGYAWVETPVAQAAAWAGPYGLTALTLLLAALPLAAGRMAAAGAVALTLTGLWTGGTMRIEDAPPPAPEPAVLRIVQQNAAQALKWREPHRTRYVERLFAETAAPPDPVLGPPDAVIWPETAMTFLPQDDPVSTRVAVNAAGGAALISGALFYELRDGVRDWTNSLLVLDGRGRMAARYDKHHLVPFGEYLPARGLLSAFGLDAVAGMTGGGLVPGPGARVIRAAGLPPFAAAICYEMIFPAEIVPPGPRPAWILTVTNDAWFGAFAGPHQHLAQARMRAIEQGLPVVRAAQTGISAVIDAAGQVVAALPLDTAGRLDAALPPPRPATLYARTGDLPAILALMLAIAGLAILRRRA